MSRALPKFDPLSQSLFKPIPSPSGLGQGPALCLTALPTVLPLHIHTCMKYVCQYVFSLSHVRAQPCPTLCDPMLFCPWDYLGKNTGVGCHFLLQRTFLTQGSNPHLLHWEADSLPLCHLRSPFHCLT